MGRSITEPKAANSQPAVIASPLIKSKANPSPAAPIVNSFRDGARTGTGEEEEVVGLGAGRAAPASRP